VAQADWGPQDSYGKGCTGKGCDGKGCVTGKCLSCYTWRVFGEYLYLRARDAEMPYAVEDNLNIDPRDMTPVQISRIAMVDPDYSSGFRVGFGFCLDPCTELVATFTKFESQTTDSITRGYSNIPQIFPMLAHPSSFLALTGTAAASASYGVDFDLIDVDYRRIVRRDCQTDLAWLVGVRYGALDQTLTARYTDSLSAPRVDSTVATDIDFHGVGLKLGFEGERYALAHPVLVYAKGFASLLAGEFDATYQQTLVNRNAPDVNTSWTAGRIVPTFDLEVGTGFCLPHGHTRATIGYSYSVWTNVVKNEDWIRNVQTNEFSDMSGAMTFDGMVVRVEGRF
jgi:hypothetical protein